MSERAALVAAVASAPADDLPKLVFADWLDENGEPERAEFVRLQVAALQDARQSPPVPDPAKFARTRELFFDHYRDWLRPVCEPFGQPISATSLPPPPKPSLLGRIARGLRRVVNPSADRPAPVADDDIKVDSLGALYRFPRSEPLTSVWLSGGFVRCLHLALDRLPPDITPAVAMAAEPIDTLYLSCSAATAGWRRFDGPHLGRVRQVTPSFAVRSGADFRPLAEALCGSAHWHQLCELDLLRCPATVFEVLSVSPLARQLTALKMNGTAEEWELLTCSSSPFHALRNLGFLLYGDRAERIERIRVAESFRGRMADLSVGVDSSVDSADEVSVDWLTTGSAWEKLDTLALFKVRMGDAGMTAIADSGVFPALSNLSLFGTEVSDDGAIALARSPLVERIKWLNLKGNPIGREGAWALAGSLERGLGRVHLSGDPSLISTRTQDQLVARFGHRIRFFAPGQRPDRR